MDELRAFSEVSFSSMTLERRLRCSKDIVFLPETANNCWWFIVILGSSSNGVGTGGVVAIAFCWYRAS